MFACTAVLLTGCTSGSSVPSAMASEAGNAITGEGIPNPAPNVTENWGELPEGRGWGSTAGVDIDPNDGCLLYTSDAADE